VCSSDLAILRHCLSPYCTAIAASQHNFKSHRLHSRDFTFVNLQVAVEGIAAAPLGQHHVCKQKRQKHNGPEAEGESSN